MTEVLNVQLLLFLVAFTMITIGVLFISIKRMYIKKPVMVFLIPLLVWLCLFVYSSYESTLGYPSIKKEELLKDKFVIMWSLPVEGDKIYLTVQKHDDSLMKMYLLDDPGGEIKKAIQQARESNGQTGADGDIPLSYDPNDVSADGDILLKVVGLEKLLPKS